MARTSSPTCDDDFDHSEVDEAEEPRPPAVALIPLYSNPDMPPYAWMLVCQGCFDDWWGHNPGAPVGYYRLVEDRT
jgi:hypothetical protein